MLVVTRRPDEEIVFSNLGIRVRVLRSAGSKVRLGIEAPEMVEVLRGELAPPLEEISKISSHRIRNELNFIKLSLEVYERQTAAGDIDAANRTFLKLISRLQHADLEGGGVAKPAASQIGGARVLVVDDDANERELLADLLRMDGCNVTTVQNGLEALADLGRGSRPDVMLLDMQMPQLDGRGTIQLIRRNETLRNLLVFAVSGRSPEEYKVSIDSQTGVDEWFEKPLNTIDLVSRIHQRFPERFRVSA